MLDDLQPPFGGLAHHVTVQGRKRGLMLASLRYLDTFVKLDGEWLFLEQRPYVDWMEERPLSCCACHKRLVARQSPAQASLSKKR
jgi:hypothetical protein